MIDFLVYGFSESMSVMAIALGFHLVFGLGGVVYLAYGAFLTLGAYAIAFLFKIGTGIILSILLGIILTGFLSFLFYRFVLSRVHGVLLNEALICLGIMLLVRDALALSFGTSPYTFPRIFPEGIISISGSVFEISRLGAMAVAPFICLLTWLFLKYSPSGKAMRAISQDREAGLLVGIIPTGLIARMVMVSTCISMVAGLLLLSFVNLTPELGDFVLLEALFAVILGGLGSFRGLILASFIIGLSTVSTALWLGSHLKLLLPLVIIFLILMFRPSGMFGVTTKLEERI
jgi:branched-chain amino acid transport system permease protein